MKAIDAFYGQNWVDQAIREHAAHPNGGYIYRHLTGMPCAAVFETSQIIRHELGNACDVTPRWAFDYYGLPIIRVSGSPISFDAVNVLSDG